MKLLLVEDNLRLGPMLARGLRSEGHVVELVDRGEAALDTLALTAFDAIVLDLMLPDIDGFAVLDRLRRGGDATPVLMLTARDQLADRVTGLDKGADDYLTKPFELDELLARLRALVRRAKQPGSTSVLLVGDLEVDTSAKSARRDGVEIALSAREYAILECLVLRRGRVVSRETLLDSVYDGDDLPESNVLEVYIAALRRKLDKDADVKLIHTRRGMGYLLGEAP
ncbi:MAG: response regulator transcription factor [Deltaproteobacteria bacterium]|nr:response regulator transcription factor [Nannocystaceae bacterium]